MTSHQNADQQVQNSANGEFPRSLTNGSFQTSLKQLLGNIIMGLEIRQILETIKLSEYIW